MKRWCWEAGVARTADWAEVPCHLLVEQWRRKDVRGERHWNYYYRSINAVLRLLATTVANLTLFFLVLKILHSAFVLKAYTLARPVKRVTPRSRCLVQYTSVATVANSQRRAPVRSTQTAFFMRCTLPLPWVSAWRYFYQKLADVKIVIKIHLQRRRHQTRQSRE